MNRMLLPLAGAILLSGCLYPAYKKADQAICDTAVHPFDVAPTTSLPPASGMPADSMLPDPESKAAKLLAGATDVRTAALLQGTPIPADTDAKSRLNIPSIIPGSEAQRIQPLPGKGVERDDAVKRLYPELSKLTEEPYPLPGPGGHPYTLDDLQRLAAANSPQLAEAAHDVDTAEGNLVQARAYPNPTALFQATPSNNGSTSAVWGAGFDQKILTSGKIKLAVAAAEVSLDNAKLALKRARSDLSTAVRNAYFALLVSKETVLVTKGLAQFTDEIYRVFEKYLEGGQCAPYEPAALQAQAYSARLAYRQAIQNYLYNWEQLVATIGLRHLPLTEVAGRIDAFIPYYDYDAVKAYVLCNHSDMKVAYNGIDIAKYNLKSAQVTPIPDFDVQFLVNKEFALVPFNWVSTVQVAMPIPVWDQNKGNILAAQGSLGHAMEEPHRVEVVLTNSLANAYGTYKTNLEALEYYRRFILPNQVVFYRGVFARRSVDQAAAFADLVGTQQALATSVTTYLATLGTLWTSVVSVADLLQTDDLFQLAKPIGVEPIPNLLPLPPLPCAHPCAPRAAMVVEAPTHLPMAVKPAGGARDVPTLLPVPTAPAFKTTWSPSAPPSPILVPVVHTCEAASERVVEPPAHPNVAVKPTPDASEVPTLLPVPTPPVVKTTLPPSPPPAPILVPVVNTHAPVSVNVVEPPAHHPVAVKPAGCASEEPTLLPELTAPPVKTALPPRSSPSPTPVPVVHQQTISAVELLEPPPSIVRTSVSPGP